VGEAGLFRIAYSEIQSAVKLGESTIASRATGDHGHTHRIGDRHDRSQALLMPVRNGAWTAVSGKTAGQLFPVAAGEHSIQFKLSARAGLLRV